MDNLHLLAALVLLTTVTAGLVRVFMMSSRVEWLLALQLLGTTTIAVVLLLAQGLESPGLRNLALVLGLLAATVTVAFVRYGCLESNREGNEE